MSCVRADIVTRSASVDMRMINKGIKNPWRWEWLEKKVESIHLNECIRKLNKCSACYCVVCGKELMYSSKGSIVLVRHVKSVKHGSFLKSRKDNFALPGEL
ncbi:hypothetical protein AVEN_114755-1 [Araneus ventricosus]|uniref:BED-type domain-containing protein n=1 Tax=Araneus ventricosus TaxID=182803 RepID=A0A4Y2WKG2_ARAVE|nr:hypothetical protein AVEN_10860-1 [Araneus ventricosus]GBO37173.1 hypothetical protein AVEN_58598-1 [Araneus ventricosus]GBO37178.1 hypothetical protein AVEN_114755-1 [Araneus ventricosus]